MQSDKLEAIQVLLNTEKHGHTHTQAKQHQTNSELQCHVSSVCVRVRVHVLGQMGSLQWSGVFQGSKYQLSLCQSMVWNCHGPQSLSARLGYSSY